MLRGCRRCGGRSISDDFLGGIGLVATHDRDGPHQPVALAYNGLHESGLLRIVPQYQTNFANRSINALFGVDEDVLSPQALDDRSPADQLVPVFHQENEQLHRDLFHPERPTSTPKLVALQVEFQVVRSLSVTGHTDISHGLHSSSQGRLQGKDSYWNSHYRFRKT